jgi:hypothetical protein
MTPEADESDWITREINRAERKRKPILPLRPVQRRACQ